VKAVKNVNNKGKEDQLTINKVYTMEAELSNTYAIMDDLNGYSSFPKSWFGSVLQLKGR
jgi:tRNA uridine 5-carbamoylmethylation protein Kti12